MNHYRKNILAMTAATLMIATAWLPANAATLDMQEWKKLHADVVTLCREQQYDQALRTTELLITMADETFGENSPFTGLALGILAELHHLHGNNELAQKLIEQAVIFMDPLLREAAPDPDRYVSNLIGDYMSQGDYIPALPYIHWKIHRSRTENGKSHPITAMNTSLLAEIYKLQGRFKESEMLFQQCLAIMESTIGLNRPEPAAIQGSLAELYALQGDLEKALPLYERAYLIMDYTLGTKHPRVITLMSILSNTYRRLGKHDQARDMEDRLSLVRPAPRPNGKLRLKACLKNMRILAAAIDLYNMDHPDSLVKSGEITAENPVFTIDGEFTYLQTLPQCPSAGTYYFDDESDNITCTRHGTNVNPTIPEDEQELVEATEAVPATETEPQLPDIPMLMEPNLDDMQEIAPDGAD